MEKFTLYHYWRSSASWRVRWALDLKKITHEKIAVDLLTSQEKQAAYTKLNPAGYVPCLVTPQGRALGESLAIMEWLEEKFPEPSFYAGDADLRCKIRQLAETINSGTQPLQNLDVQKKHSSDQAQQSEWIQHWIKRGMRVYETILAETRKEFRLGTPKFSVADHPTIADLCLIPQCQAAQRFQVALEDFPLSKAVFEHALTTKPCQDSHPDRFKPA